MRGLIRRHRQRFVFGALLYVGLAVGVALSAAGALVAGVAVLVASVVAGAFLARQIRTPADV
jgi:hypothetical protein